MGLNILEIIKWTLIDTSVIMIPFAFFLWRLSKKDKATDEFIKKHYRL